MEKVLKPHIFGFLSFVKTVKNDKFFFYFIHIKVDAAVFKNSIESKNYVLTNFVTSYYKRIVVF